MLSVPWRRFIFVELWLVVSQSYREFKEALGPRLFQLILAVRCIGTGLDFTISSVTWILASVFHLNHDERDKYGFTCVTVFIDVLLH